MLHRKEELTCSKLQLLEVATPEALIRVWLETVPSVQTLSIGKFLESTVLSWVVKLATSAGLPCHWVLGDKPIFLKKGKTD